MAGIVNDREILTAVLLTGSISQAQQRLGVHYRIVRECLTDYGIVTEQGCRPDRSQLQAAIDQIDAGRFEVPVRNLPPTPTREYPAAAMFRCAACGRRTTEPVCLCGQTINPVLAREAGAR